MANFKEYCDSLLSVTEITDLSVADVTTIYTVPVGKTCILTKAIVRANADVGASLAVTIGSSGTPTDFLNTQTLSNLDAASDAVTLRPVPNATPVKQKEYAAAILIQIDVSVAGNAVAGTVYLFGILDDA